MLNEMFDVRASREISYNYLNFIFVSALISHVEEMIEKCVF